jgi:GAF domain-containing protein
VIDHSLLNRELVTFASALTEDFDLNDQLHRVTLTAASALGLDGAGVTLNLPNGATHYLSATDPTTMHVEQQQDALKEGACVDAIATSEVVTSEDLSAETRWPRFTPVLLEAGMRSAAGVPIRFRSGNIGAVNLYAKSPRAWSTEELDAGRLLADLAAGYLVNSYLLRDTEVLAEQLQQALNSRIVIEQAKGLLAGRHQLTMDAAFEVLRSYARSKRTKLHTVAEDVVAGSLDVMNTSAPEHASEH